MYSHLSTCITLQLVMEIDPVWARKADRIDGAAHAIMFTTKDASFVHRPEPAMERVAIKVAGAILAYDIDDSSYNVTMSIFCARGDQLTVI